MKLREILIDSASMGEYDVVYAKRPWSLESAACIKRYEAGETVQQSFQSDSPFEYFLDAVLIQDIRSQVADAGKTLEEALDIILYYAENDAFPL